MHKRQWVVAFGFVLSFGAMAGLATEDLANKLLRGSDQTLVDYHRYRVFSRGQAQIPEMRPPNADHSSKSQSVAQATLPLDIHQARDRATTSSVQKAVQRLNTSLLELALDSERNMVQFLRHYPESKNDFSRLSQGYRLRKQFIQKESVLSLISLSLVQRPSPLVQRQQDRLSLVDFYLKYHKKGQKPFPRPQKNQNNTAFTGLIVDLRPFDQAQPVLFPTIYDESGFVVYDVQRVANNYVARHGLVAYVHSLAEARKSRRAGDNPYYLTPISLVGSRYKGDPVILRRHSKLLLAHDDSVTALKRGKVLFILSQNKSVAIK